MAVQKKRNVVTAQKVDEDALIAGLQSQGNAIPLAVANVLRVVAPILARIAIRFIARKLHRTISEQTIRTGGALVGSLVGRIIERAAKESL